MRVTYKDQGKPWRDGPHVLEQATALLADAIGSSADKVTAEWDRTTDEHGRSAYHLHISDSEDSAETLISADEFNSPRYLRIRLLEVWGDLLQTRNHRLIDRLHSTSATED